MGTRLFPHFNFYDHPRSHFSCCSLYDMVDRSEYTKFVVKNVLLELFLGFLQDFESTNVFIQLQYKVIFMVKNCVKYLKNNRYSNDTLKVFYKINRNK